MTYVVVDLEMNISHVKKEGSSLFFEIIQIGAIAFSNNFSNNLNAIDTYNSFVKPQYSKKIKKRISVLTGITDDVISSADSFDSVLENFFYWLDSFEDDIVLCQWSDNDLRQFKQEVKFKNISVSRKHELLYLNDCWFDIQKKFSKIVEPGSKKVYSLKSALELANIEFNESLLHNALYDAEKTGSILRYCCTH